MRRSQVRFDSEMVIESSLAFPVSCKLPQTWFYKNAPLVFVKDWRKIDQILDRLLRDPARLRNLHEKTLNWWNDRLSPSALAEYVVTELRRSTVSQVCNRSQTLSLLATDRTSSGCTNLDAMPDSRSGIAGR